MSAELYAKDDRKLEAVAVHLKNCLEALEPIKVSISQIEKELSGQKGRIRERDVALSKLMFRRIESLAQSIIMVDLESGEGVAKVMKSAANISKMARETISAIDKEGQVDGGFDSV